MVMNGSSMKILAIPGLGLPAGKMVDLKPGGHHVLLMGPKQQLKPRDTVPVTLVDLDEGADGKRETIAVNAPVKPLASDSMGGHGAIKH